MKFFNNSFFLAVFLFCSSSTQLLALSPPAPVSIGKISIFNGPIGADIAGVDRYDYQSDRLAFYSPDQKHRLEIFTTYPYEGQQLKFEYDNIGSYLCHGTASVKLADYESIDLPPRVTLEQDSTIPSAKPIFSKLIVSFSGECSWTDGLVHTMIYRPFSGLLEIENNTVIDQCQDLSLENMALKEEIAKIQYQAELLIKENSSLQDKLNISEQKLKKLSAENVKLKEENIEVNLTLSDSKKAVAKANPKSISSLRNLHSYLKKRLVKAN